MFLQVTSKGMNTRREAKPFIHYGARDPLRVRKTAPTPLGGATTGDNQSSRRKKESPGHPRVTKSPTPGGGPIARIIVVAAVLLGRIIMRPRESRRVRQRARLSTIKGLRRRTGARQYWSGKEDRGRRGAAGRAAPRGGADEPAKCRSDHPAITVLVSAPAMPYSSLRRRWSVSAVPRWYWRSKSRSPTGRDTIAET